MNETKPIELGNRLKGEMEMPPIDIEPHIGKKVAITQVRTFEGKHGPYVLMETDAVDEKKRIHASRIFSLCENPETNEVGWVKDGKLAVFLKKVGAATLNDCIGKVVTCVPVTKAGKEFLSFA